MDGCFVFMEGKNKETEKERDGWMEKKGARDTDRQRHRHTQGEEGGKRESEREREDRMAQQASTEKLQQ